MVSPTTATAIADVPVAGVLDAQKLDVYRVAVQAQVAVAELVPAHYRVLRDQVERASVSVVLNVSEGAGRRSRKDKRRHYTIARGTAMEVAAALDLVAGRKLADETQVRSVRQVYVRIVRMLTKLDSALH